MSNIPKLPAPPSKSDDEKECFGWLDDANIKTKCRMFNFGKNKKFVCKTVECLDDVLRDKQLSYKNKEQIINCLKKITGDDIFLKTKENKEYPLNYLMKDVFNKKNKYPDNDKLFLLYMSLINPKKFNDINWRFFDKYFLAELFINRYLGQFEKFYSYLPFNRTTKCDEQIITQYLEYNDIRFTKIFENNQLTNELLYDEDNKNYIQMIINEIKERKNNYNIQVLFDDIKYFHNDKSDDINKLIRKINLHLDNKYKLREVQGLSCEDKFIRMLRTVRINRGIDYDINNYFNYIKNNNLEECLLTIDNKKITDEIVFVYYGMGINLLYDKIEEVLDVYERYIKNYKYGGNKIKEEELINKLDDLEKKLIDKVEKYDYKRLDDMDKEDIIKFIKNI